MTTSPPRPPSPPLGPPRGTYFSRRKARQPLPPSPPLTWIATRSTNIAPRPVPGGPVAGRPGVKSSLDGLGRRFLGPERDDVDPPAALVELHGPLDQREDRPVAADPDALAGVPLGAGLAADDAARLGVLAAVQLDAPHLGVRVPPVAARTLTLLVSHRRSLVSMP